MNQYHKTKREVIFSYLDRFPDAASNCLARMIYKAEPILFASKEQVRSTIRTYRGAHGKHNREGVKMTKYYKHEI
jgi:hypothetical protein